jgi:coproporphyrinogen III oxidase-like Fe-S oxidoreductase
MLNYDMPLYRPPSEGRNLIIQATLGCSANHCSFCAMYKDKDYFARPLADVFLDIDQAALAWPDAARVFLADGDALCLPMDQLLEILDYLAKKLPNLPRVSAYATPKNLIDKSVEELQSLKAKKLSLVYLGIESGSTQVLRHVVKGASQRTHGMALDQAYAAGLKVSATVILGLAGQGGWKDHIEGTAKLINDHPPTYLSTLQLHIEDDLMAKFLKNQPDGFEFQDDTGILEEQEYLLDLLKPVRPVIFRSNHASNCLALAGNLPKDSARLLAQVRAAQQGEAFLRPRHMRAM